MIDNTNYILAWKSVISIKELLRIGGVTITETEKLTLLPVLLS